MKQKIYEKIELRNKLGIKNGDYCEKCKSTSELTLEHIIPYWWLKENLHYSVRQSYKDEWNFKILCRACNADKNDRIDFTIKQVRENFIKYLEKVPIYKEK